MKAAACSGDALVAGSDCGALAAATNRNRATTASPALPTARRRRHAIFHATGKRIRELPITLDKLI